jgi:hypothetical protein
MSRTNRIQLSDPKELEEARKANVFEEKCTKFVKRAVETLLAFDEH